MVPASQGAITRAVICPAEILRKAGISARAVATLLTFTAPLRIVGCPVGARSGEYAPSPDPKAASRATSSAPVCPQIG